MKKPIIIISATIIAITILFVFSEDLGTEDMGTEDMGTTYETITIGTIHRDAAKMTKRYQPMIDHIAENLSNEKTIFEGKVFTVDSQEQMIKSLNEQKIDIYFDSPLIGMKIQQESKISPMLLGWKEGVPTYHSVFITPIDSEIESLDNLSGKTIVFEDPESTSGYLLPKYHLETIGYSIGNEPFDDISFEFSLDDENTPIWILEGKGDFGALSNIDFEDITTNAKNQLKIIGETEEVPRQIVFFREGLEKEDELLEVFLEMKVDTTPEILNSAKTTAFTKINSKDMNQVIMTLNSLNFE